MYVFAKPRYLRTWQDPVTRQTVPAYQFDVTGEDHLSFLLESGESLTVRVVEDALRENVSWWHAFLQQFLTATVSYFSRPYTVAHLERILRHTEVVSASTEDPVLPRHIRCIPRMFQFSSGTLHVYWTAQETPAGIALPEEDQDDIPPILDLAEDLKEWDAEALPEETTGAPSALLDDPAMLVERQRVKEARLRAKLAVYRAQYQMNRYYDKYGDEISESDEDDEDDEDEEDEDEEDEDDGPFL